MHPPIVSPLFPTSRSLRFLYAAAALVCGVAGCRSSTGAGGSATRVLFVGNSLTSVNDLPEMLEAVADDGGFRVTTGSVVFNDVSLSDHLSSGGAAAEIARGDWDYVVLQQGPSGRPESRVQLIDATRDFATIITAAGARTALYMVWPDASRRSAFDSVSMSYTQAADAVGGLLFPAGDAWTSAWEQNPALRLYGDDGFHPSPAGSYLAALAIYAVLCDRSPATLPVRPGGVTGLLLRQTSDADLRILQVAAGDVTANLTRKGQCAARPT